VKHEVTVSFRRMYASPESLGTKAGSLVDIHHQATANLDVLVVYKKLVWRGKEGDSTPVMDDVG
jgi:hypothetical protein